ncbi:LacI family DNA-binding transcriptional regulator [Niveispirillum sp. BGYR6]|uniref:LacI family DNA-binding transcriptional regulator n=1 Tax=Niveispirillum sp. BGYR6 TaxID=2971249 RepID=UPI0022B99CB7|nr:LacI family DNA-binding transcriptional regulator [Niveispirillum sp. BGYR6]MDG5496195.1 LacI family DNA-binding transcriptional regulator [Niveispirillum sp. BGYR6]
MSNPTIHDVAALADVSIKTVSRVLNGEDKVKPATRERVMAAVRQLGYSLNLSARSLSGARNYILGLVFHAGADETAIALQHEYVSAIQIGAINACRANGYHLMMEPLDLTAPDFETRASTLLNMPVMDGFIIMPPLCDHPVIIDMLIKRGANCVRISPSQALADLPLHVGIDDYQAAYDMTGHLLDMGHRRIGFIGGPVDHASAADRFRGFKNVLEGAGCFAASMVRYGDYGWDSGLAAGLDLLTLPERPTAIFALNDMMALGVYSAAHRLNLHIPNDVSVAGIDDTPSSRIATPPLTTVRQPIMAMGFAATEALIKASAGEKSSMNVLFAHELIERDSIGKR